MSKLISKHVSIDVDENIFDVAVNLHRSPESAACWPDPTFVPFDLTPEEALELADYLKDAAREAISLREALEEMSREAEDAG